MITPPPYMFVQKALFESQKEKIRKRTKIEKLFLHTSALFFEDSTCCVLSNPEFFTGTLLFDTLIETQFFVGCCSILVTASYAVHTS
jgi:hypothetical protein